MIQWSLKGMEKSATVSILVQDVLNGVVGKPYAYEIAKDLKVPAPATSGGSVVMSLKWMVPYEFRTSDGYQISVVVQFEGETDPIVTTGAKFKIFQTGDAGKPGGKPPGSSSN